MVEHYNNGGVTNADDPVNDFLSGGIRPLNLTDQEKADLVAFMEALTSPEHEPKAAAAALKKNAPACNVKTATTASTTPAAAPVGGNNLGGNN